MSNTENQQNDAPGSEPTQAKHRRVIMRSVIVAVAAGMVALGVVGVASTLPATAEAAHEPTTARAHDSGLILHVAVTATETTGTGARTSWSDDAWIGFPFGPSGFGGALPAGFRQILHHSGISVQTGVFGRGLYSRTLYVQLPGDALYDPSRDTIYELKPVYYGPPFLTEGVSHQGCRNADSGGFYVGMPATLMGGGKRWDRRVQASELAGDMYLGGPSKRPFFSGFQSTVPAFMSPCLSQGVAMQVHYGSAKLVGTKRIDGHRASEFRATDGVWSYYADARTHRPLRLVIRGVDALETPQSKPAPKSEQVTLTINIQTFDQLPFRGNEQLLDLTAQHPGVRIDTKASDYYSAQARLFPLRRWG